MRKGFTLVELAIVLVIIGLLAGGVIAAQSMIKASQMRSLMSQISRYTTAVITFRDQYQGLPGDLSNAAQIWGAADGSTGNTAACLTATGTGTQTCNGNGNNRPNNINSFSNERLRFWQHLVNAGLIEGKYSGVTGPLGDDDVIAGVNVPTASFDPISVFTVYSLSILNTNSWWFPNDYGFVSLLLGADTNGSNWNGDSSILFPEDAWNIDMKMDDGKPGGGKITTMLASRRGNCATSDDPATADYKVTNKTLKTCILLFNTGI